VIVRYGLGMQPMGFDSAFPWLNTTHVTTQPSLPREPIASVEREPTGVSASFTPAPIVGRPSVIGA
jgi:hypothetical protein